MSITSVPSSDAKPTGAPSSVAISVSCAGEPLAERCFVVGASTAQASLLRLGVVVRRQLLDAVAEDLREQRRVGRQHTAAARRLGMRGARIIARPPRSCRPWNPSARRPSRRVRRGCDRTPRSSSPCARRVARVDQRLDLCRRRRDRACDCCQRRVRSKAEQRASVAGAAPSSPPARAAQRVQLGNRLAAC